MMKENNNYRIATGCVVLLTLLIFSGSLFAADWSKDYQIITQKENRFFVRNVKKGNVFSVHSKISLASSNVLQNKIMKLDGFISNLKGIVVKQLNIFVLSLDEIEAKVDTSSIILSGKNYNSQIPSTISFILKGDDIQYVLHIVFGKYIVKMYGLFLSETELAKQIRRVSENPLAFIRLNNPAYLSERVALNLRRIASLEKGSFEKIRELQSSLDRLRFAYMAYRNGDPIRPELVVAVLKMKKTNPSFNAEKIVDELEKMKIRAKEREVNIILQVYKNDFSSL